METNKNKLNTKGLVFITGKRPNTPLSPSHLEAMMKKVGKNSQLIINVCRY